MRTDPSDPRLAPTVDPRFVQEAPLSGEEHEADDAALVPGAEPVPRSNWQLFRRRFFRHKLALVSIVVLIILIVACFGAKWLAPYPKNEIDLAATASGPSAQHWMGTDDLGRDQMTEIMYAGQVSLAIGLIVAFLATIVGVFVGAVAGFFAGFVDQGLSRLTDLFLVIPEIAILAVVLKALDQSPTWIIVVLAALGWMYVARVVRGQVLSIKEKEYVEAARASGASNKRIITRHIIPNTIGPIMVNMTLAIAAAIIAESTLSFLGFGIQPPDNSWGRMLSDAEAYTGSVDTFYRIFFPGVMILITVLAVNFLGDGLRDAFDAQGE